MTLDRRYFLKAMALAGAALPLQPLWIRQALAQSVLGYPRLIGGPMVGAVDPHSARLWMRATGRFPVAVRYGRKADLSDARTSTAIDATPTHDYVVKFTLDGLEPGTKYYYCPWVNEKPAKYLETLPTFSFCTAPEAGRAARFRIGFGSCARWQEYPVQPIWTSLRLWEPDLFFWLGDNVYADTLERSILSDFYKIQRKVPEFQPFGRTVPQLAIWDDHDFGLNNQNRTSPVREDSYDIFRRFWANPSYGTAETKGVFFHYTYGGVDFFFLDTRYHRMPNAKPDGPEKTMLGKGQKAWLKEKLLASKAPFKVVISGSGWTYNPKAFGEDTWTSFRHERDEIFNFIRDEGVSGVILMSGDVHRAEANCIPWSEEAGYDLFEMVSSGLAQGTGMPDPVEVPEVRLREPFTGGHNAGIIDFDMTADDPVVRFNVVDITGQTVWDHAVEVRASQLRNGVASWREKVDPELLNPRRSA
ncbi:MAG TPA: alkaline phosphatase D family protein [Oleiagrimonas sp.]|nr:alkaline phosphatase D family protein [Oleiagrimonas sp.]